MGIMTNLFGDSEKEERIETIISELEDSPNKVFVWQFSGIDERELGELFDEELEAIGADMQAHHIFMTGDVDIEEISIEGIHPIKVRDSVYEYVKEEEDADSS